MTSVPLIISPLFNRTFKQNNKLKKELLTLPFLNHFNWVQLRVKRKKSDRIKIDKILSRDICFTSLKTRRHKPAMRP